MSRELPQHIEAIDRAIDNTALTSFLRCKRLYDMSMRQHRREEGPPAPAIAYGSIWHTAMEWHYKTDGDESRVDTEMILAWRPHEAPDDYRTLERARLEYRNYVKHYGKPSSEAAQTVGWPTQPMVELSTEIGSAGLLHPYAGKLDRLIHWSKLYYIEDHKTTSRWTKNFFDQFRISNQMMGYVYLAGLILGKPIAGVRINVHVIRKRDSQFERQIVTYSKERMQEWLDNHNDHLRELEFSYKNNFWPGNYTDGGCSGKYGMCRYMKVCKMPPRLRQNTLEHEYAVRPWNPLAANDDEGTTVEDTE